MVDVDVSEVDRGSLAMLAGVGFIGIVLFFYFFMVSATFLEPSPKSDKTDQAWS